MFNKSEQITKGFVKRMKTLIEQILAEASIFGTVVLYQNMIKQCSGKCQQSIKNGKNYQSQVSVCTSMCKIRYLRNLLTALQSLRGSKISDQVLDSKIMYVQARLQKEIKKLNGYRSNLKKRQTTTPVNMSLKPSPDRWDPSKLN